MKNKKIGIIFLIVLVVILLGGYIIIGKVKEKTMEEDQLAVEEYTPQEEIAEEQVRQTIVSLYFPNRETNELTPEARLLDIKEIINNPYEKLVTLLIEGPKNEKNKRIIPENTKINKTYLENDCVVLDFSPEFLNYKKEDEQEKANLINGIVNTLTELTEVNQVKILIDGNQNSEFAEVYTRQN